jgi:hypothetical protein
MNTIITLLGYVGVIFLVLGYLLLVLGHVKITDTSHVVLNVVGSLFVVIALFSGVSLPILFAVGLWFLISLFGYFKHQHQPA